jgi:biotin carboxyl carrier protein
VEAVEPIRAKAEEILLAEGPAISRGGACLRALMVFIDMRDRAFKEAVKEACSTLQTALHSGYFDTPSIGPVRFVRPRPAKRGSFEGVILVTGTEERTGDLVSMVLKAEAAWTLCPQLEIEKRSEEFDVVDLRLAKTREYGRVVARGFSETMDAPSPVAGKIAQIVVNVGDKVSIGTLIARVESAASEAPIDTTIPAPRVFKDVLVGEILMNEGDTRSRLDSRS